MGRKLLCILASAAISLSMAACWDHVEINTMLIISGIGLDVDNSGETYHATVEFVNVEADRGENIVAEIVEGQGNTLQNAIQDALLASGGMMFGNHCKVIVVGEELAKMGLGGVIEMVLRSPDFRKTVEILVAKDTTAADIFAKDTIVNDILSYELSKILRNNEKSVRNTVFTSSYELHETLAGNHSFNLLPTVFVKRNGTDYILVVDGCAVLAGDQLQGFIDGEQSKLFQLIARNKKHVMLTMADGFEDPVNVNVIDSKVSLFPNVYDDTLFLRINVDAKATLEKAVLFETDPMNDDSRKLIEKHVSEQLSTNIAGFIHEVQIEYGSDIFEFYREFQDVYRNHWNDTLQKDWRSHFRDMDVLVTSNVKITGSGLIGNYAAENYDNAVVLP